MSRVLRPKGKLLLLEHTRSHFPGLGLYQVCPTSFATDTLAALQQVYACNSMSHHLKLWIRWCQLVTSLQLVVVLDGWAGGHIPAHNNTLTGLAYDSAAARRNESWPSSVASASSQQQFLW